jgi:hypothetical protein
VHDSYGILIVNANDTTHADVAVHFGFIPSQIGTGPTTPTAAGQADPVFAGPFGAVSSVSEAFNMSVFPSVPGGATVLGKDPIGPTVVVYKYGSGKIIVLGNIEMIANNFLSAGTTITTQSDIFLCNIFASVYK